MKKLLLAAAVACAPTLLVACGGDACEEAGTALCEAACACGDDDGCRLASGSSTVGFSSIGFDSEADCEALYVNVGCAADDGSSGIDWEQCESDVEAAMCVDLGDDEQALAVPASCEAE